MNEEEIKWKKGILEDIEKFSKDVPIEWDRVIDGEDYLIFYGWVKNQKHGRDFVHFMYIWDENGCSNIWSTSSVKYTDKLNENLGNTPEDHSPCQKFDDYFKGVKS